MEHQRQHQHQYQPQCQFITQTASTSSCVGCNGVISGGGSGLFTVLGEMHCMKATHNDFWFSKLALQDCAHVQVLKRSVKQDDAVDGAQI
jgi:hypothetical protein